MKDRFETDYFIVCFSSSKSRPKNFKFNNTEKRKILDGIIKVEEVILTFFKFSRIKEKKEKNLLYRIPIIFEKWRKDTFENKYPDKYGSCIPLKFGTTYNKIPVTNNSTFLICLSPEYKKDILNTISHELFHAIFMSFEVDKINSDNKELFHESLASLFSLITKK